MITLRETVLFLALFASACGATSTVPSDTSSDTCEGYRVTDSCMNQDNFRQCQEMAQQCPGEVQVLESCPLQFACPR
jgi:hypothetical protein